MSIQPLVPLSTLSTEQQDDIIKGSTQPLEAILAAIALGERIQPEQLAAVKLLLRVRKEHSTGGPKFIRMIDPVLGSGVDIVAIGLIGNKPRGIALIMYKRLPSGQLAPDHLTPTRPSPPGATARASSSSDQAPSNPASITPAGAPPLNAAQVLFKRQPRPAQAQTPATPTPAPRDTTTRHPLVQSTTGDDFAESAAGAMEVDGEEEDGESDLMDMGLSQREKKDALLEMAKVRAGVFKEKMAADETTATEIRDIHQQMRKIEENRLQDAKKRIQARQTEYEKYELRHKQMVSQIVELHTGRRDVPSNTPSNQSRPLLNAPVNHPDASADNFDEPEYLWPVGKLEEKRYKPFLQANAHTTAQSSQVDRHQDWLVTRSESQSSVQGLFAGHSPAPQEAATGAGQAVIGFIKAGYHAFTGKRKREGGAEEEKEVMMDDDLDNINKRRRS